MSKGYWVVRANVNKAEEYSKYVEIATGIIKNYKGKFLIRGGRSTSNEGDKSPRTVVIEFPTYDEANNFYNSKEYQDAHSILEGYAERQHQTIEGA